MATSQENFIQARGRYFRVAVTFGGGGGGVTFGVKYQGKKLTLLSGSRYFRGGGALVSEFYAVSFDTGRSYYRGKKMLK